MEFIDSEGQYFVVLPTMISTKRLLQITFFSIASLLLFPGASTHEMTGTIQWLSWEEAVELQKTKPKKLFIDVYTDWCGWCKKMDASTFSDPEIGAMMNKYYYAVKLDAERMDTIKYGDYTFTNQYYEAANGRMKKGTHQLAISLLDAQMSYPSYVILDENNSRISIHKGYMSKEQLTGVLLFYGTQQSNQYKTYLEQQFNRNQQQTK